MNNAEQLEKVDRKIDRLASDIAELQEQKRTLRIESMALRSKMDGLVPHETILESTRGAAIIHKPTRGQFQGYYSKFGHKGKWANVLLLKKDGSVGKRKSIFYNWKIAEDQQ